MIRSIVAAGVGVAAALVALAAPGTALAESSSSSLELPGIIRDTVGPHIDAFILNESAHTLTLQPGVIVEGKEVISPPNKIAAGPNAHGNIEVAAHAVLSEVEVLATYNIDGTSYKARINERVPVLGEKTNQCEILDAQDHVVSNAPFKCTTDNRSTLYWNPQPTITLQGV